VSSTVRPAAFPVRRPPAPRDQVATVAYLGRPGTDREVVPVASIQGTLALDLHRVAPAPPAPDLRVVDRQPSTEQREVRAWAARFAQAAVEVLGGDRPVSQLLRWTSSKVYADLDRRVRILGRTSPAPTRLRTVRPQVQSVHVCRPTPRSAEVSVHVRHGQRSRAIAARLELRHGRWTCVALQLG
jgi:Family of unknown function (DUF6459)